MSFRKAIEIQRKYFHERRKEITERNLKLMRLIALICIVLYLLFALITDVLYPAMLISLGYSVIVPIMLFYFIMINHLIRNRLYDSLSSMIVTIAMFITLNIFIIILSVFPHRDVPAAYFPLFLVIGPVMFIMPIWQQAIINVASFATFFYLVIQFKNPIVWSHELFEVTVALFFSFVVMILMIEFRVQSDSLSNEYYYKSQTDPLTGALNKKAGESALHLYVETCPVSENFALYFMDIDGFKQVNDKYGHMEGDRVLAEFSKQLMLHCRTKDIVCRFGGDEFFIAVRNLRTTEQAEVKAGSILRGVHQITYPDGSNLECSIGISFGTCRISSADEILKDADVALYEAKASGKNKWVLHDISHNKQVTQEEGKSKDERTI